MDPYSIRIAIDGSDGQLLTLCYIICCFANVIDVRCDVISGYHDIT